MMLLSDVRPDGMIRRPDGWCFWTAGRPEGWQWTEFFDLQTVQNLLETLLNSGIPVKEHHYKEVILVNLTSLVPSYAVSKIYHASLADSQFEILANSDGESVWHRAWRPLSLESRALFWATDSSAVVASGLIQPVSTTHETSIDFKKKHIRAFQYP